MDPEERPKKVLLVEDHHLLRQALAVLLGQDPGFEAIAQAGSVQEARGVLGGTDVAVVDLGLPDGDGVELIRELLEVSPGCAVLVMTASLDRIRLAQAVEAGAAGLVYKAAPLEEILDAVRRLREGETLLSAGQIIEWMGIADRGKEHDEAALSMSDKLTPREREVLQALGEGLDNKEISHRLGISQDTERNYVASLLTKLGARTRLQALVIAIRHGLVDVGPKDG